MSTSGISNEPSFRELAFSDFARSSSLGSASMGLGGGPGMGPSIGDGSSAGLRLFAAPSTTILAPINPRLALPAVLDTGTHDVHIDSKSLFGQLRFKPVDQVEIKVHAFRRHGEGRAAQLAQSRFPLIGTLVDVSEQQATQHATCIPLAIAGA